MENVEQGEVNDFQRQLDAKEKIIFEQRAELNKLRVENKVLKRVIEESLAQFKIGQEMFDDLQRMFNDVRDTALLLKQDADNLKKKFE